MQGFAQQPDRCRMLGQQGVSGDPVADRGELHEHGEVVGQLLGADREAGLGVGLLETDDGHAAVAGVPVGPVGQERAGAALHVEDLDVVPLDVADRGAVQMREELRQRPPDRLGQLGHRGGEAVEAFEQHGVGVDQQPRAGESRRRSLALGQAAYPKAVDRRLRPAQAQWEPEELRGLPTADPGQPGHGCTSSSEGRTPGIPSGTAPSQLSRLTRAAAVSCPSARRHAAVSTCLQGVELLHGHRHQRPARDASPNGPEGVELPRATVEVQRAAELLEVSAAHFHVCPGDHIAVLVLGDRQSTVSS